jgi:hypothetical protein
MIALLLGLITLLVLMGALGAFSRAHVAAIKQFGIWTAAIGGLVLAALLFLTGREGIALAALAMLGPLIWDWVGRARPTTGARPGPRPAQPSRSAMSREEAFAVLGLAPGASAEEIRAAHKRLMQRAHPDHGGSDWLAARINQARDVLLD